MPLNKTQLQRILDKSVSAKNIFGGVVSLQTRDEQWTAASGNLKPDSSYYIASTSKLFVTTIIMQMRNAGQINLEDPIAKFLPAEWMNQLHVYKGRDYSSELTVHHLLSQTSGLADYFGQKTPNGKSLQDSILTGKDQGWGIEEVVRWSKNIGAQFIPGQKRKALYSDTNFQLLGKIIEIVRAKALAEVFLSDIILPLQLTSTYLYQDTKDTLPINIYYKSSPLHIPLAMSSFKADGGIVSNAEESLVFIKAFFEGRLFPHLYLKEMQNWNKIFFPLQYGVGLARFALPRIFSPFKKPPELIGHSGLSGAFAFYSPQKDAYISGTLNQIDKPQQSFRLILKLLDTLP